MAAVTLFWNTNMAVVTSCEIETVKGNKFLYHYTLHFQLFFTLKTKHGTQGTTQQFNPLF